MLYHLQRVSRGANGTMLESGERGAQNKVHIERVCPLLFYFITTVLLLLLCISVSLPIGGTLTLF